MSIDPNEGLNPITPQHAAGCLIDPPVQVPIAMLLILDAIAAAEPPLEPPAINSGNFGFLTNPK